MIRRAEHIEKPQCNQGPRWEHMREYSDIYIYIYIYRYTLSCVPSEALDCTVVFQYALPYGSYCSGAIIRLVLLLEQRGSVGTQAAALCECRTHKYQREGENKREERESPREREGKGGSST